MDELQIFYEETRKSYLINLSEKLDLIKASQDKLSANNEDISILNELYGLIHSISGSSGILGFTVLSENCQELELYLFDLINSNSHVTLDLQKIILFINKLQEIYTEINK